MKELIKDYLNFYHPDSTKCKKPFQWWMLTAMITSIITILIVLWVLDKLVMLGFFLLFK